MKKFLSYVLTAASLLSCSHEFDDTRHVAPDPLDVPHDMIVLGSRLDDPYSVDNMTKALESLYPTKAGTIELEATDLYVRFLPQDSEQFEILLATGIDLLDHPMDYEIVREGDYYIDPSVGDDAITWQYSVVPVGFSFPHGIRYEILDECFITENYQGTRAEWVDWEEVEMESYRLTGNSMMVEPGTRANDKVAPSGRITIVDEKYDSEPFGVAGVKVSCNSFVKFASAYTDEQGYYTMKKKYATKLRYRLVFKNEKGFGIGMNLLLVPGSVSTLGEDGPQGKSCEVTGRSDRWMFSRCVVNNAAYDYYTACVSSGEKLKAPPSNLRFWLFRRLEYTIPLMMQQGAVVDNGVIGEVLGDYAPVVKMFLPDIALGIQDSENDYAAIYSKAMHELSHASHFVQVGKEYWDNYLRLVLTASLSTGRWSYGSGTDEDSGYAEVCEMWAFYLQTVLYRERYQESSVTFGTGNWFYPQIFLYLDDRAITRSRIFQALTDDVTDRSRLQDRLVSMYPEERNVINQAFLRYV